MTDEQQNLLTDDIPSSYIQRFGTISKDQWKQDDFRKKVIEIVGDCHKTTDFEKIIEGFIDRAIQGNSRDTLKKVAKEAAKEYYEDDAWKRKTFWIPVAISVLALFAALAAVFKP